jgi:class 3 adenylate cyclase
MRMALARHDAILCAAIIEQGGHVYKNIGDAFQAAFALPAQAVEAALVAQRRLLAETWPTSTPIRVRMGLHIGPAETQGSDYATTHTLNRVARIMSTGHGGQVLLSVEVADLLRDYLPADVPLRDMGQHRMKGLTQLEHLFQVVAPDLPARFPPLASLDAFPNNLPLQLTSFVGREKEIAEVKRLLGTAHRLVTLKGVAF